MKTLFVAPELLQWEVEDPSKFASNLKVFKGLSK